MQESIRTRRVAELIKHEIARIINNDVSDPKVHDVVITLVKVTKDLDLARVFFNSYDKKHLGEIKLGLERSGAFIRRELIKAMHIKKVPRLEFVVDEAGKEAEKIERLLDLLDNKEE